MIGTILLDDNVARMILQNLTDKGHETLAHSPYSPDLSHTNNLFQASGDIFMPKHILFKRKIKTIFKDFLASKPFKFFCTGINFVN